MMMLSLADSLHQQSGIETPEELRLKQRVAEQGLTSSVIADFRGLVYGFYRQYKRDLPWRLGQDPYRVLVSEVMLQQTQVERVIPKFLAFMELFPTVDALAVASLASLLSAWQGLGYNRRALHVQKAACQILDNWQGAIPNDPQLLQKLPGIGPYTAGAICAFAYNRPEIFLETNIRAVLLHFFFPGCQQVSDRELLPVAAVLLDHEAPRDWYNALMDYGSDLKRRFPNPSRRSKHHAVQSRFAGSDRQIRGAILRCLLNGEGQGQTLRSLSQHLDCDRERLKHILAILGEEGLLQQRGGRFLIPVQAMEDRR